MFRDKSVYVTPPEDGKAKIFDVPSKSIEGKTYKLRVMSDGELRCSCPFFVFSGKVCSHIESFASVTKPKLTKPMQEKPVPVQKEVEIVKEKRIIPF